MIARGLYRQAARLAARASYAGGSLESVAVHRSAATGEASFPRSDIDLLFVLRPEASGDPEKLATLYRRVRALKLLIPRLGHIDVHEAGDLEALARVDTYWASIERRSGIVLAGSPIEIPGLPVEREHALAKFGLWLEWFVPISIARRDRRNLVKTSLEAWNACAVGEGSLDEPLLRRAEMEAAAREREPGFEPTRLADPAEAARLVFGLAARFRASILPDLGRLDQPMVFDAITAPLLLRRRFVVLPHPDSPLPPETFEPGAFPCTPESLDLYLRFTNPLAFSVLPPALAALGFEEPGREAFVRACRYYGHGRFLYNSGFAGNRRSLAARVDILRAAADALAAGRTPDAIPQQELRAIADPEPAPSDYYRRVYPELRRRNREVAALAAQL